MKLRECDKHGCGFYGASRGSRQHKGVDIDMVPGEVVKTPISGTVTKVGYPYGDDLSYRYVQITKDGYDFRLFYVEPLVENGDYVQAGSVVGHVQNLGQRYPGITDHVHLEIKRGTIFIDPTPVFLVWDEYDEMDV